MIVEEGGIKIEFPDYSGVVSKKMPVFFNPNKKIDRDISVEILKVLKPKKVLDLLAGTGIRGLRIANIDGIKYVMLNDANKEAFKFMKKNLERNKVKAKVEIKNFEANKLLYSLRERFDYIDIDPFGSPNKFLQGAILNLQRNGILAATSTDTAPLSGTYPKACLRKYGAISYRTEFFNELGIRILMKKVIEVGAQFDIALTPIFCHATRHYFRAYFKKDLGSNRCDKLMENIGKIFYCKKCLKRGKCEHGSLELGPVWKGKLWNFELVEKVNKINDILKLIFQEYKILTIGYYTTDSLARVMKREEIKINKLIEKLREEGFLASRTHFSPKGIRTNAKINIIKNFLTKT